MVREVDECKYLVLRVRENQEGFLHPSPSVSAPGLGEGFARSAHWSLGLLLRPPMGLLRAKPIYALNADRSEHPSAHAATLCPVAAHQAPNLQEGIMYKARGVVRVASHSLWASE